jgi:hypothetical protein
LEEQMLEVEISNVYYRKLCHNQQPVCSLGPANLCGNLTNP